MLIPSIDLMGGKIVQLVQGEKKALRVRRLRTLDRAFSKYPLIQLIDLDAAIGRAGANAEQSEPGALAVAAAAVPGRRGNSHR